MGSNPPAPLTEVLRAYNESDLLLLPDFGPSAQCANDSCGKILTVIEPPSRQMQSVDARELEPPKLRARRFIIGQTISQYRRRS